MAHLIAYSGTIFLIVFVLMHFFMYKSGHGCGSHGRHGGGDTGQDEEGHRGCGSHGKHSAEPNDQSKHDGHSGGHPEGASYDDASQSVSKQHEHNQEGRQ